MKSQAKNVETKPVPFYFIVDLATKREVFYIAGAAGKGSALGNLSKINAQLKKNGMGEAAFPKTAKFCAGTATRVDDVLILDAEVRKGVSGATLLKSAKKLNLQHGLNLGLIDMKGPADDVEEQGGTDPDDNEELEEEEEVSSGPPELPPSESEPSPPTNPPVPPPPPSTGPRPEDLLRLRATMKARCSSLQKGDAGQFVYFEVANDGSPLLLLSRPGTTVEGGMLKAGQDPVEGSYRCVVPGGVELVGPSFDTKPFVAELGIRCRFASGTSSSPATQPGPPTPPPEKPASPEKAEFDRRMALLEPGLMEALRLNRGDAGKLRAAAEFAREKAENGDFAAALKTLSGLEARVPPPSSAPPTDALMLSLSNLGPSVDRFVAAQPGRKEELLRAVAAMQTQIKGQRAGEAAATLEQIRGILISPPPRSASAPPPPVNEADFQQRWSAAAQQWSQAIAVVDGQISQVSALMRASDDTDLQQIAELGLPALTNNHKTPVMRALIDVPATSGEARRKAVAHARTAIGLFRLHLESYPLLQALDEHSPVAFGVQLSIGKEIGGALNALEAVLEGAE